MEWKTLLLSLPLLLIAALAILWASRALGFLAGKNTGESGAQKHKTPMRKNITD